MKAALSGDVRLQRSWPDQRASTTMLSGSFVLAAARRFYEGAHTRLDSFRRIVDAVTLPQICESLSLHCCPPFIYHLWRNSVKRRLHSLSHIPFSYFLIGDMAL
jgi:hypothetical protein